MKVTKNPNYYAFLPSSMSSVVRWLFASPQVYVWSIGLCIGLAVLWATATFQLKPSRAEIAQREESIAKLTRMNAKQWVQLRALNGGNLKPEDSHGCYEPYKWNSNFKECSTISDH